MPIDIIAGGEGDEGKLVYCATPSRLKERAQEISEFVSKKGLAPFHPFIAYPYNQYEENPNIGRELSMHYCGESVRLCNQFWLFGFSDGTTMQELPVAVENNKRIAFVSDFDPEWEKHKGIYLAKSKVLSQLVQGKLSKYFYLTWERLENLVAGLVDKMPKEWEHIAAISSGGLLIGKIILDNLTKYGSLPNFALIPASNYHGKTTEMKKEPIIGEVCSLKPLEGRVLVVDDLVDTGMTMQEISRRLAMQRGISNIETAAVFRKSRSKFKPTYYCGETDRWVIFPDTKNEYSLQNILNLNECEQK